MGNSPFCNSKCGKYSSKFLVTRIIEHIWRKDTFILEIVPIKRHLVSWLNNIMSLILQTSLTKWAFRSHLLLEGLDNWQMGQGRESKHTTYTAPVKSSIRNKRVNQLSLAEGETSPAGLSLNFLDLLWPCGLSPRWWKFSSDSVQYFPCKSVDDKPSE